MGHLKVGNDVPKAVEDEAAALIVAFGLEEWEITLSLADQPGKGDNLGYCLTNYRYLRADVEICRAARLDEQRYAVAHELLHPALAALIDVFEDLPEKRRARLRSRLINAEEQTIERLRRGLQKAGMIVKPLEET